ncbi:MAG: PAS domain-containing protein, partial [Chloroflexota bacterium]
NLPDSFVLLFDRDLRLMLAEGTALTKSGFPHEGVEGKTLSEVLPPKDYARLLTYYQSALNGIENIFEDYYDDRVYLARSVPIRNEQGEIFAGMMLSQEITTLKKAEQILAEEKERLAVTLRSIGDGVITTDLKGIITLQNRVAEQLTGWKQQEAIGQPLTTVFQIINEATRLPQSNPVEETLATGQVVALKNHTLLIARNGTERPIADSCAPISDRMSNIIGTVLVFRDMTEQKRLNEELLKSSKLEAIGVLAGGIAHDFNNLLSGIMGFLDLTRFYLENENRPQNEIIGLLEQAQKATLRSKELTLQLLTFAKGGLPVKKAIQLDQIIRESASFVLHGTSVEPIFDLPDELWSAEVDPGQLGQVIQNLVLNAVQAMPSGGRIKIQAENLNLTNGAIPPLEAGKYTKLLIRDEGTGISPETLQNIFDPYFTTKSTGSGLGLAVCYSIIKKHDGLIKVESVVGKGTAFQIYLPASNHLVEINEPLPKTVFPLDMNSSSRKLLVMDDDALLRDMIRRLARLLGYEVALAKEGQEAVELYRIALQTGQPFNIVLLDLTIPGGLGGKQTIAKLLELDPHVKAIVCSGYSSDPVMSDYRKYGFSEVLIKPYQLKDLRLVLERLSMDSSSLNSAV